MTIISKKTLQLNCSLLSLSCLLLSAGAHAATTPGTTQSLTGPDAILDLEITNSTQTAEFGDEDTDTGLDPVASALISVPTGRYAQAGTATTGTAVVTITNNGTADFIAHAVETIGVDPANVSANIQNAIQQSSSAVGLAQSAIDNSGDLNIRSEGYASGFIANAQSRITSAITQTATSSTSAQALLNNRAGANLTLTTRSTAIAGAQTATANAGFVLGLSGARGIVMSATGTTQADAAVTNAGTMRFDTIADASGNLGATATARFNTQLSLTANSSAGTANGSFDNSGDFFSETIAIASTNRGIANASLISTSYLGAQITSNGLGNAQFNFSNSGRILATNVANATSLNGDAAATADDGNGFLGNQQISATIVATGGGNAIGTFTNDGQLSVDYRADASAAAGTATINVAPDRIIHGLALSNSSSSSFYDFTNRGNIQLTAIGFALGNTANLTVSGTRYIALESTHAFGGGVNVAAELNFLNQGRISLLSDGIAQADGGPSNGYISTKQLLELLASNFAGSAVNNFTNTGDIIIGSSLSATATGNFTATAGVQASDAFLVDAHNENVGTASALAINQGTISISARTGANADDIAHAETSVNGGRVEALSLDNPDSLATAEFRNSGTYTLEGTANATADEASAFVIHNSTISTGVAPHDIANPGGDARVILANSGLISAVLQAEAQARARNAIAHTDAEAIVAMFGGAHNGDTVLDLSNSGTISFDVNSVATGPAGAEALSLLEGGITMQTDALLPTVTSANITLANSGNIVGGTDATADGGTGAPTIANTIVGGLITQSAGGTDFVTGATNLQNGFASVTNDGLISYQSDAVATSDDASQALSDLTGIVQSVLASGTSAMSINNAAGEMIDFNSFAEATGITATAEAQLLGISQTAAGGGQSVAFTNQGIVNAASEAAANAVGGSAIADATLYSGAGGDLAVDILNAGTLNVDATVYGIGATTLDASAVAVTLQADRLTGTISNTGAIHALAETPDGSGTNATAILINSNGGPTASGALTINNSGDLTARHLSTTSGQYTFGTVIDTSNAPVATNINLLGGGSLYGNIELSDDDVVTVSAGETEFEGIINARADVGDADVDGDVTEIILDGTLNIAQSGTLYMRNNPDNVQSFAGAAQAHVQSFNIAAGGTLALELPNYSVASLETRYPQIFTDVANITGGHLAVRVSVPSGLFADNYFYDNVIDANDLTGRFGSMSIDSMFLRLTDIYDSQDNVDLSISRIAFNDPIFGLDGNAGSAAGAIETDYDPTATGDYQDLVAELLSITDSATYVLALDSLHAAQYAGYLQSLGWMGAQFGGLLGSMNDCPHLDTTGDKLKCQSKPAVRLWGKAARSWEDIDTAPATQASGLTGRQSSLTVGLDTTIDDDGLLGIAVGTIENDVRFDLFNGAIKSNGWQAGIYGAYDNGLRYITGWASYSDLNGDAVRDIAVGSIIGFAQGNFDAHVWNVGSEIGARFALSKKTHFVPYAKLDYSHSVISAFTETGVPGANLQLDRSHDAFVTGQLGGKLESDLGDGFSARADLGWRHSFTNTPTRFDAAFAEGPGTRFTVIGPDRGTDALVAAGRLTWRHGERFRVEIGYDGRFADSHVVHTGQVMLRYRF